MLDSENPSRAVPALSIVLPCHNEARGLARLLPELACAFPEAEILVVDDGSSDDSVDVARDAGVRVVSHPYNMGNGAAVKTGARNARGSVLVFLDADGQHSPADISRLLEPLEHGYDMVVGARDPRTQASMLRGLANRVYNLMASYMTGMHITDLTSGFRAVKAQHFRRFLYLLPNGFSYPTTITMAFFRSGLGVRYISIKASKRIGKSHIRLWHDGLRFVGVIIKIGALFSPMRLFVPIGLLLFGSGLIWYAYTYYKYNQFTNMGAVLFLASLIVLLIGVVAEQIASLHYRGIAEDLSGLPSHHPTLEDLEGRGVDDSNPPAISRKLQQ